MAIELINGIEIELQGGTRGLQGYKGDKGDPGNSFDPMIGDVETLSPGSQATVTTNVDEEGNILYFNFGIPQGNKGDTGGANFTTFDIIDGKLIAYPENPEEQPIVLGTVAMETKGTYNADAYYEYLNIVNYNGDTYVAKQAAHNIIPTDTDYWQYIAGGVAYSDIVDNLESIATNKVLSANQGKMLDEKKPTIYENVASMKADNTLKDGMTVQTLGYYAANDGGGATYKITDTESLTDYQEEVGDLYATLIINETMTPDMFGAYGDGTHDDTTSFTNACNYSKHIKGNGLYKINTITLNNVKIDCDLATGETSGITFNNNVYFTGSIKITSGSTVASGGRCIYITGENNIIERATFYGDEVNEYRGGAGIVIEKNANNNKIINCVFPPHFGQDIIVGGINTTIEGCLFEEHTDETLVPISLYANGIKVSQYLDFEQTNGHELIIKNNTLFAHGDNPIDCYTGADNVLIDGNYIYSPDQLCIEIKVLNQYDSNLNYKIVNNTMTGYSCMYLGYKNVTKSQFNHITVSNNYFKTTHGGCLNIDNSYELLISDNQFVGIGTEQANSTVGLNIYKENQDGENCHLTVSNCSFSNFYNVINEGNNNFNISFDNVLVENVRRFSRVNNDSIILVSNSIIKTIADTFGSCSGRLMVSNSYLENNNVCIINNSSAIIGLTNCVIKSSATALYRTAATVLPKIGIVLCDYSQSNSLSNFGITPNVDFTTVS